MCNDWFRLRQKQGKGKADVILQHVVDDLHTALLFSVSEKLAVDVLIGIGFNDDLNLTILPEEPKEPIRKSISLALSFLTWWGCICYYSY